MELDPAFITLERQVCSSSSLTESEGDRKMFVASQVMTRQIAVVRSEAAHHPCLLQYHCCRAV